MSHHPHIPPPRPAERFARASPTGSRSAEVRAAQRGSSRPAPAGPGAHSLGSLAECLELALQLSHDFDHAHVAALTGAGGQVVDGTVLSDAAHTIDHAAGFALCLALACAAPNPQLTFFSVRARLDAELSALDRACWRRMRDMFAGVSDVRDWIITDGIAIRSVAVSTGDTTTWASPAHEAPPNTSTPPNRHAGDA